MKKYVPVKKPNCNFYFAYTVNENTIFHSKPVHLVDYLTKRTVIFSKLNLKNLNYHFKFLARLSDIKKIRKCLSSKWYRSKSVFKKCS